MDWKGISAYNNVHTNFERLPYDRFFWICVYDKKGLWRLYRKEGWTRHMAPIPS